MCTDRKWSLRMNEKSGMKIFKSLTSEGFEGSVANRALPTDLAKVNINTISRMSRVVRKPAFCICENKDADQLHGNREADQRLCFRYIDSTIPLLSKYIISSL